MLDNTLPAGGYLKVTLPSTMVHVQEATCHHWALAAGSLASGFTYGTDTPTGTLNTVSGSYYCSFTTALTGGVAYGLALGRTTSSATAGVYAPVALQTRMNRETTNIGPVLDTNQVFDSVAVGAASVDLTVTVTKTAVADQAKVYPGESYSTTFAFEFGTFAAATKIAAPYNIVMTLGKLASQDRVQIAASTEANGYAWTKYPHVYEDWVWTPTCTNLLFGVADATDALKNPKMNTPAPTCTLAGQTLTIAVTDKEDGLDFVTNDKATFKMHFDITIANPGDLIGVNPTLSILL